MNIRLVLLPPDEAHKPALLSPVGLWFLVIISLCRSVKHPVTTV